MTHYDCGEMTENKLYALNQVSKSNIAAENLEISRAEITMYTKHFRQQINATGYTFRTSFNSTWKMRTRGLLLHPL